MDIATVFSNILGCFDGGMENVSLEVPYNSCMTIDVMWDSGKN
jgi:hypothetical protein